MAENEVKIEKKVEPDAVAPDHHKKAAFVMWVIAGALLLLIIAGGTFAVVRRFVVQRNFVGANVRTEMMSGRGFGGRGGMMRGYGLSTSGLAANELSGKVTAVNDKQFTVSVNSTSKTIQITDSTRFPNTSATKVAVGDTVVVVGQQDSNGVIQATEVAVNPTGL